MSRDRVHEWTEFERAAGELAAFGKLRLDVESPNFLATVRNDALPRVHPVSATVKGGHLALYMYPNSPKGKDLILDGRYALHCSVADHGGGGGEFHVRGYGMLVDDPDHQAALAAAGMAQRDGYVIFELGVDEAFSCTYEGESADPVIHRWRHPAA